MIAADVRQIVEAEIGNSRARKNAHGCTFDRCLVEPYLSEFEDVGSGTGGNVQLWVVLEEDPELRDGYKIVFEEAAGEFGLACPGSTGPVYLGRYGSFLDAFDAM